MEIYVNPNRQDDFDNAAAFENFMARYAWATFFKPQPEKAPWHVQCKIETSGLPIILNFWPHKAKAQRDGEASVVGWDAIRLLMSQAIDDSQQSPDDFDVIEDAE